MAEQEPRDTGQKGGAAEGYAGHYFYEPTVTAVTDMVVPATRIQWGPTFAGLVVALSVTFLWASLGIGLGIGIPGILYWLVGFSCLGLFLGSMLAARTAKAGFLPAILHGVIIWSLLMILDVFAFGGLGGALVASMSRAPAGAAPVVADVAAGFGWWFFGGFLCMLAASILGGIVGVNPPVRAEEQPAATP